MKSPAAEAMIERLLDLAGVRGDLPCRCPRARPGVLTDGSLCGADLVQPGAARIAHAKELKYPSTIPMYGDWIGFQPDVWWYEE